MFDFPGGQVVAFCVTFAVGAAGFALFRFLRIPQPTLLGAMVATGALNVAGLYPLFNTRLVSFVASVVVGVMVGRLIDRTVIRRIVSMAKPVAIQTIGMLVMSLICGLTMHFVSGIELRTSLISTTAGGITEMIVFGMSMDADVSVIAFIQVFRIVIFVAMIPYLVLIAEKITGVPRMSRDQSDRVKDVSIEFFTRRNYLAMIPLTFAGGTLAYWLGIPAGAMLGAMFAGGGAALFLGKRYEFDSRLRFPALIGIGIVTGERITPQFIEQLGALFIPAIVVTVVMLIGCSLLAILLYKASNWSLTTCMLCVVPSGISQIVPLAEDLGADPLVASVFHTTRIVGIVMFYPWLVLPLIS